VDRIAKIQGEVKRRGWDAILICEPIDLFWATGLPLSAGKLWVGEEVALEVDGRYREMAMDWPLVPKIEMKGRVGFDSATMSVAQRDDCKGDLVGEPRLMQQIRAVKDEEELKALRKAGALAERGAQFVAERLRPGVSEIEMARELEIFWLQNGGERLSFEPIIAFGSNGSRPHHHCSSRRLKEGESVLCDMGVQVDHYQSDLTRLPWKGDLEEIESIVAQAKEAAEQRVKPGVAVRDLDKAAREIIAEAGYGEAFCHGLGHGVGLEVHELPLVRDVEGVLEAGMIITIEPGIYLPGRGGVRLEDTLLVTETGFERLPSF